MAVREHLRTWFKEACGASSLEDLVTRYFRGRINGLHEWSVAAEMFAEAGCVEVWKVTDQNYSNSLLDAEFDLDGCGSSGHNSLRELYANYGYDQIALCLSTRTLAMANSVIVSWTRFQGLRYRSSAHP